MLYFWVTHLCYIFNGLHARSRGTEILMTRVRYRCEWEVLHECKHTIMDKYFSQTINPTDKCEVFCIEDIPVASFVYNNTNAKDDPIVDAFYINVAFMMIFDTSKEMRKLLYDRHEFIDIRNAKNRNYFFL